MTELEQFEIEYERHERDADMHNSIYFDEDCFEDVVKINEIISKETK